jgi:uncharacterized membrane protein (UPF0127 family)
MDYIIKSMEIVNETKGFTISAGAEVRDTAEGRRRGLMGQDPKDVVLSVWRESSWLPIIHMFGMRYPIDVVWVNEKMEAVDVRRQIPPSKLTDPRTWRMHKPSAPAKHVIEIGAGDVKNTEKGDRIKFKA